MKSKDENTLIALPELFCYKEKHKAKVNKCGDPTNIHFTLYTDESFEEMHIFPKVKKINFDFTWHEELELPKISNKHNRYIASKALIEWLTSSKHCRVKGLIFDVSQSGKACKLSNVILYKRNSEFKSVEEKKGLWSCFKNEALEIEEQFFNKAISVAGDVLGNILGMKANLGAYLFQKYKKPDKVMYSPTDKQCKDCELVIPVVNTKIAYVFKNSFSVNEVMNFLNKGYYREFYEVVGGDCIIDIPDCEAFECLDVITHYDKIDAYYFLKSITYDNR